MALKLITIRWIRTGSQPDWKSNELQTIFYEYSKTFWFHSYNFSFWYPRNAVYNKMRLTTISTIYLYFFYNYISSYKLLPLGWGLQMYEERFKAAFLRPLCRVNNRIGLAKEWEKAICRATWKRKKIFYRFDRVEKLIFNWVYS